MFSVVDPTRPPFEVDIARHGAHTIVSLRGELDIATEGELAAGLALVSPTRMSALTIDLSELEFLDSTGLRALVTLRHECETHGCRTLLVRGGPAVMRAFEVSGLAGRFTIVDEPEQALAMHPAD